MAVGVSLTHPATLEEAVHQAEEIEAILMVGAEPAMHHPVVRAAVKMPEGHPVVSVARPVELRPMLGLWGYWTPAATVWAPSFPR